MELVVASLVCGLLALGFAAILARQVVNSDTGNDTMRAISLAIQEGATAFLRREYRSLAIFAVVVAVVLGVAVSVSVAIAIVAGAACSVVSVSLSAICIPSLFASQLK